MLVTQEAIGAEYVLPTAIVGSSLAFSPDGRWLAILAHKAHEEKDEKLTRAIEADVDWTPKRAHFPEDIHEMFIMDLSTRQVRKLTDRSVNVRSFDWSPDSRRLVLEADSQPGRFASYMTADIYLIDVAGGPLRPLVKMKGKDDKPVWSPDGKWIAFASQRGKEDWMYTSTLAVVPADGSAPPQFVGEALDQIAGGGVTPLRWSADGRYIDVRAMHDLSLHVFRVRVTDGAAERVTPRADRNYLGLSYSRDRTRMAMVIEGAATPPDVYVSGAEDIKPVRLTRLNPAWEQIALPKVDRLQWRSADGKWNLNGLVLLPSDHRAGTRYPMLTAILGGPQMVWQELNLIRNYPLLVLAQQGYAVFVPNSRGREGYGMDLTHAIRDEKSYVQNPIHDVLSGIDALVEKGIADPDRLGVMGFSYGGTLTANLITHTNRFRAAIYGEGEPNLLQNMLGYWKTQGLGLQRDMMGLGKPYEPSEIQRAFEQSAIYRLNRVRTPVLIEAGELSKWEGDRAFYRGLKYYGVPAEFYVYPRSHHGWSEPLLKQDAFRRHIDWFDYWIKGKPYPDPRKQANYDAWTQKNSLTVKSATSAAAGVW